MEYPEERDALHVPSDESEMINEAPSEHGEQDDEGSIVPTNKEWTLVTLEDIEETYSYNRQSKYGSEASSISIMGRKLVKALEDKLATSMIESAFEGTRAQFVPQDILDTILLQPDSELDQEDKKIGHVLQLLEIDPNEANEEEKALASFVLQSATRLFLIIVLIRVRNPYGAMAIFKAAGLTDETLPIEEWPLKEGTQQLDTEKHPFFILQRLHTIDTKYIWTMSSIMRFREAQMKFLAPVISTEFKDNDFGHFPMPFIACNTIPRSGAHGIVHQYTVHPAHVKFEDGKKRGLPCVVAVKAFRASGEKNASQWRQEVIALKSMNELNNGHAHIVRFLIAFVRGMPENPRYYIMFEWADGGNLGDFWKGNPSPVLSASLVKWVVVQLHGLTDALAGAHASSTRHGDIKPSNILWFRGEDDLGILKLGDWGQAVGRVLATSLRHDTTPTYATRRYEPPETHFQSSISRSRLYDLWSLGCVTFEFIVWLMYGFEGLKSFNGSDYGSFGSFYEPDHAQHTAKVHPVVLKWMEHMGKDPVCRSGATSIGDLLEIVCTGLLLVKIPPKRGLESHGVDSLGAVPQIITEPDMSRSSSAHSRATDQSGRIPAAELKRRLQNMLRSSQKDSYWQPIQKAKLAPVESTRSINFAAPPTSLTQRLGRSSLRTFGYTKAESDYSNFTSDPGSDYGEITLDSHDDFGPPDNRFTATSSIPIGITQSGMSSSYYTNQATGNRALQSQRGNEVQQAHHEPSIRQASQQEDSQLQLDLALEEHLQLTESHMLEDRESSLDGAWMEVRDSLPESWRSHLNYNAPHTHPKRLGAWTCRPVKSSVQVRYPLRIAGAPVVIPVQHRWPPLAGVAAPPDPYKSQLIDCEAEIPLEAVRDMFQTFEGSLGFYILVNGFLQVIIPDNFDIEWASTNYPHLFGGLKVSYIRDTRKPTMRRVHAKLLGRSREPDSNQSKFVQINDEIGARPNGRGLKAEKKGRIGLRVLKQGVPYLLMSTHVITQAIIDEKRTHSEIPWAKRKKDTHLPMNWMQKVEIWAGNEQLGTPDQAFDSNPGIYPNGFEHDITTVKLKDVDRVKKVTSPVADLGWLNHNSWSSLTRRTSSISILGPTECDRTAETLENSTPSKVACIGTGIFHNGLDSIDKKSERGMPSRAWRDLISVALLYRIHPILSPPYGHSGIALIAEGSREDGSVGPGIVGFQSFVQHSDVTQVCNEDNDVLSQKLEEGVIAFYGAFEVPEELKRNYTIV